MGQQTKPNIIIFFTDQQRWDTVGCYGTHNDITPNLDKAAQNGVRFQNAFSCQPVCTPARACIQTGRFGTETGVFRNRRPLAPDENTIAKIMRNEGYEAGYIGKWHLAITRDKPVPLKLRGGYEDFWLASDGLEHTTHPYEGLLFDSQNKKITFKDKYRADAITDFAIDYLRTRTLEKPFFLFLSYLEPHHQNDMEKFVSPDGYAEKFKDYPVPGDLIDQEGDWRDGLADYYGMCKRLDENFGRINDEIEALGLKDNTIIIYTSDHGCHFKTRNSEYKRSCHESSIRIPLIISGPGFESGEVREELASLIDIAPTVIDIGGASIPEYMHGKSLKALVDGEVYSWPENVFIQISETGVARAIRTGRWKYCVHAPDKDGWKDSGSKVYLEEFLYDLESDPYEKVNLIGNQDYMDICNELAEALKIKMAEAGEEIPVILRNC